MKNLKKGFTLIELLVVIAIVGILSAIVLASLGSAKSKGDDTSYMATMTNMKTQAEIYYHNNNSSYGISATTCDTGLFNATTPGGLDTLMESLKSKAGSANISCVASSTSWVVVTKLKAAGTFCVDGKGSAKASTTITLANITTAYNAGTGTCNN